MTDSKPGPKPFEYSEELYAIIEKLSSDGLPERLIAYRVGRHPSTFSADKKRNPRIDEHLKKGTADLVELAGKTLRTLLMEKNPTITIFTLKAKADWRESIDLTKRDDSENDNELEEVDNLTLISLAKGGAKE